MLSISERKLAMKWHKENKSQEHIANLLGCHQSSISRLIKKQDSHQTVANLPRSGKPTKLTKATLLKLKHIFQQKIIEKNEKFGSVTTKEFKSVIHQEIGELYSIRHVERIMHKLGFSLITPRTMHTRHDQNAVDKFRDEFKKKSSRNIWVMN